MKKFESVIEPLMWSMALLLVGLAAGCGGNGGGDPILGGGGGGVAGAGALPAISPGAACSISGVGIPTVLSSDPTNGNSAVPTTTAGVANSGKSIFANFSMAMNPATISSPASTFTLATSGVTVAGAVAMNLAKTVAILTTSGALSPNTLYQAIITTGAQSASGVPLACPYQWSFTTAAASGVGLAPLDLGILAPFAIATAGGITDAGASKINGDVVLFPTSTCDGVPLVFADGPGFGNCGGNILNIPTHNAGDLVITGTYPDPGTTATAVMVELLAKWNELKNLPLPTVLGCSEIGTGGGFGGLIGCSGNATLPPGLYTGAPSIGVTGVLTLDGGGDQNARFVFQMPSSTLTTAVGAPGAPGSQIVLINGAKASNVWWQVGSNATLNAYSEFQGNILASATIAFGTGVTSCGRMLSGAEGGGSLTMLADNVSVPGHPNAPPTGILNVPATCQ